MDRCQPADPQPKLRPRNGKVQTPPIWTNAATSSKRPEIFTPSARSGRITRPPWRPWRTLWTYPFGGLSKIQVRHFAPLIADANVKNKIDLFFTVTAVAPKLATIDVEHAVPVDRVVVIGAGLMGQGIAQVCADGPGPAYLTGCPGRRGGLRAPAEEDLHRGGRRPRVRHQPHLRCLRPHRLFPGRRGSTPGRWTESPWRLVFPRGPWTFTAPPAAG